jgi:hypothetical protein
MGNFPELFSNRARPVPINGQINIKINANGTCGFLLDIPYLHI